MTLNQTVNELRELLNDIQADLEKAVGGNKAASQRVRTGTVSLEKVAKRYRKESIVNEKKTKGRSKTTTAVKKKPAVKAKAPTKTAAAKPAPKTKAKTTTKTATRTRS